MWQRNNNYKYRKTHGRTSKPLLFKILIALYTKSSFFCPFCHNQKLGLKIVIIRDIIVNSKHVVVVEVEKVKVKMEEVVVLGQWLVVEIQEVEVQLEVEV